MKNCVLLIQSPLTLEEIAKMWGLSKERIRQIESRAIVKFVKRFASLYPIGFTPEEHDFIRSLNLNPTKLKLHPTGGWPGMIKHLKRKEVMDLLNLSLKGGSVCQQQGVSF